MANPKYLRHSEIDKIKWDRCIKNAPNQLIYAWSFYLDIMSPGWDALVMNDYEIVMPLTFRKKWGIRYLYQPPFTQQSGISGKGIDASIVTLFLNKAAELFPFIEINLNYSNDYNAGTKNCNLVLSLNKPFEEIKSSFRKDLITKAKNAQLIYGKGDNISGAIDLYKLYYSNRISHVTKDHYERLRQLCNHLKNAGQLLIREVKSPSGEVLAISILYKDDNRIYYILSATLPGGRMFDANAFLLHEVIREFSGQDLLFDFEGSNIPGIQFFFKKFGAIDQPYYSVKINRLPFLLKKVKKISDRIKKRSDNF